MRIALIAAALLFTSGSAAFAQTKPLERAQPWASACEGATTKRVQKEVPDTPAVTFDADSELQWSGDNGTINVRGDGQYAMPKGGKQPISFECTYDPKSQKVTNVRYTLR